MKKMTLDGNAAAAYISYAFSEIAVIYPITPSSPMAEQADEWSAAQKPNLFGEPVKVVQMQSESGVAGAIHGCLTCGALATTYTCSQGLLLMLPDMYKIAGELLPTVFHVSSRAIATHALSIFGDHQDVMAARQTGFAMLASSTVQEAFDFALIAHLGTLKSQIPFLHFFDGFRTSHETVKIDALEYEELSALVDHADIERFRRRALTPDKPIARGTTQNPDTYFQNREASNPYYLALPQIVQATMDKVAALTGRYYHLFDYYGAPDATRVITAIGSASSTAEETVDKLLSEGEKVGLIKIRLYRPFDKDAFFAALPSTCRALTALDRTKEAGALGEPLYLDVCAALQEKGSIQVRVYGSRYGLGGKEVTPADIHAVFENMKRETPKNHFTLGILDDLSHASLSPTDGFSLPTNNTECIFYGLGSDGTVGANKNSIKVIGENTDLFVQGYFCYDSRKSGGVTISHLRFGKSQIRSAYLIKEADFVACHNPSYVERYDMLSSLKKGGVFLLNCPWTDLNTIEKQLPVTVKRKLAQQQAKLFVIDGNKIAEEVGLSGRISTVMQAAFFYLQPTLLPYPLAKKLLMAEIERKFSKKGGTMVEMNALCIEKAEQEIQQIAYPESWKNTTEGAPILARSKEEYFQSFILPILSLEGDKLPVSAFSADGSVPTETARLEKHGAPPFLPKWIIENCIQCNQCAFVCPHACIRPILIEENTPTPSEFLTKPALGVKNAKFRIQVSPHDCMGCGVCARTCPTKEKSLIMTPSQELLSTEGKNWETFENLPQIEASTFKRDTVKGSQFYPPLFEFSYACSGCGETPYIKLLTQLFGEEMLIANATGCSSIYGASSPTCPYATNKNGHGPAWANSLFEDNAEFGFGMRLALDRQKKTGKSVWIIGGDGWAYDIGYGGLDHVLSTGANVNILVLDTEVYSNTGGQASKSTPQGAVARFAMQGKGTAKKNLGLMAICYEKVYVAQVSMGANKNQLLRALTEAKNYDGPSLIIAYAPCIAHGVYLGKCMEEEKLAVDSGYWHLYRYNPDLKKEGKNPFQLDSPPPTKDLSDFFAEENRFGQLKKRDPKRAETLFRHAQERAKEQYAFYQKLSTLL